MGPGRWDEGVGSSPGFWAPRGQKVWKTLGFFHFSASASGTPPINEVKLRLRPSLDQAWLDSERRSAHTCCEVARGGSQSLRDSRRAPILRSSKEIARVSRDCWSRGGVYILHGLCFGYRFRLRDDEKRSNEPAQFCMFFGPFGGNFGLLGWPRGLLRPRRGLKRASGGLRGGPGGAQGCQKSSIGRS